MTEQDVTPGQDDEQQIEVTAEQVDAAVDRLKSEENFSLAMITGGIASLIGAGIWAAITIATEYQIGWLAVGVGFLVAITIRQTGKGMSQKFQVLGATLALLGCVLGNFFTICGFIAQSEAMGFFEIITQINPAAIPDLMAATFSPMDLLFYGIAVYEGYRLSLRQISEDELIAEIEAG
jgi:hypothetical protein